MYICMWYVVLASAPALTHPYKMYTHEPGSEAIVLHVQYAMPSCAKIKIERPEVNLRLYFHNMIYSISLYYNIIIHVYT